MSRRIGRARVEAALAFGVSEARVRRAIELSKTAPELFERVLAGTLKLNRALVQAKRTSQLALIETTPPPTGTFRTLTLDPPWQFRDEGISGSAAAQYATQTPVEIAKLPVKTLAAPEAHVYLWVPSLHLAEALWILAGWGFELVTTLVWDKRRLGLGHYARNAHELVLFGVRGKLPPKVHDVGTVFTGPVARHSQKPEEFFQLVERLSPGPYIEMYARATRPGWTTWGAEVPSGAPALADQGGPPAIIGSTPEVKLGGEGAP